MGIIKRETCWKCVFFMAAVGVVSIALLIASYKVDARQEIRFQIAGEVRDQGGEPLAGVEAVLFLKDPNLLARTVVQHRFERTAGLSDGYGLFKARVKRFWKRFPFHSSLESIKNWCNAWIGIYNFLLEVA